jgi:hypothetical protein
MRNGVKTGDTDIEAMRPGAFDRFQVDRSYVLPGFRATGSLVRGSGPTAPEET